MKYAGEQLSIIDLLETPKPTSPLYLKYQETQDRFPNSIIVMRIGDFYEVMGDEAEYIAGLLDITLTGRLVGNGQRVSMCGFPSHISEKYIEKMLEVKSVVVMEDKQEFYILSHDEARKDKGMIEKHTHASWLLTCPCGDGNFKVHLKLASKEEIEEVLNNLEEKGNKQKIKVLTAELNRRNKQND